MPDQMRLDYLLVDICSSIFLGLGSILLLFSCFCFVGAHPRWEVFPFDSIWGGCLRWAVRGNHQSGSGKLVAYYFGYSLMCLVIRLSLCETTTILIFGIGLQGTHWLPTFYWLFYRTCIDHVLINCVRVINVTPLTLFF